MKTKKRITLMILALGLGLAAAHCEAQTTGADLPGGTNTLFQSLYCFGFSWTDTQGILRDGGPDFAQNNPQYWRNRTSNGPMWPEFFSTNLGLAYVRANNYARGAARAGTEAIGDVLNQVINFRPPA